MPTLKRLGFFLIGLSFGLIFLAFFFRNKKTEFCYLPNCRVLKDIRNKKLTIAKEILEDDKTLIITDFSNILTNGDIDFSASDTEGKPCKTYVIEGFIKEKEATITVSNCKDKASINTITYQ